MRIKRKIATVEEALEDIKAGKIIVVIDDPDREKNEGDLICAARICQTQENVKLYGLLCQGADLHAHMSRGTV